MKKKYVNCYNCDSNNYILYDTENGYNLVKCNECGLLYVNPRPNIDEITNAALTGLHKGNQDIDLTGRFNNNSVIRFSNILNDIYGKYSLKKGKLKWLDIGCGFGEFIIALGKFNPSIMVIGSEPNETKRKYALKLGLNVDFIDLDIHKMKYDIISMLNVYSHLPKPLVMFKKLHNLLNENGELLIETGHSSHLPQHLHHKPYYLPDHLSFANEDIMINILKKSGFDILYTKKYPYFRPKKIKPIIFGKDILKFLLGKPNQFQYYNGIYKLFAHKQSKDLWIRAQKK